MSFSQTDPNYLQMVAEALEIDDDVDAPTGGEWLVDAAKKVAYWKGRPPAPPLPNSLQGMPVAALPKSYQIAGEGRAKRGPLLLHSYDRYLADFRPAVRAPSDTYNPFGRFKSGPSSFIPGGSLGNDAAVAVRNSLQEKDQSFQAPKGLPPGVGYTTLGYPTQIITSSDAVLDLVRETEFGAVYGEAAPVAPDATQDPARRQDPARSALKRKMVQAQAQFAGGPQPSAADPYQFAQNMNLTKAEVEAQAGVARAISQAQVMGASAGEAAAAAGYAPHEGAGWEWLHLIAHSMGGIEVKGPQVPGNLVAGTSECNSQMIVVEEFLKDYVRSNNGRAGLMVAAELADADWQVAKRIVYDFVFHNSDNEPVAVFHYDFNTLSRTKPMAAENRSVRYAAREQFEGGGAAATTHMPLSEPTAHRPYTPADKDPLNLLVEQVAAAMGGMAPHSFVQWLAEVRRNAGGKLDGMVFDEIGDRLTRDTAATYIDAIARVIGAKAAERVRYSFLLTPQARQA